MGWEKCEKHGWAGSKGPCPYCEKFAITRCVALAHVAKVPGRPSTVRSYVEAWLARSNEETVKKILLDPWTRGKTVIEIHDHFFPKGGEEGKTWKEIVDGDSVQPE